MGKVDKQTFVCLDCETTGLDIDKDRIIEIAVVKFQLSENLASKEFLIDPECAIPVESIAIHHITQDMISGKPKIGEVLSEILDLIGRHIIVGHGIGFDIDMVDIAAKRIDIPCKIKENLSIDTLRLARLYGESPTNSLAQLRQHFNVGAEIAHRAMSDVLVNIEVFKHLVKPYPTTEKIFEILSRPILLKEMPLGKHKGRPFKEIPYEYLRWAANKDFDRDLMYSIKTELKKRSKGNLFSQASNPFQDL